MYMISYILTGVCQISAQQHNLVQYVYSVCVDRDQLRLLQLELLSLIVSVNFQMVSALPSVQVQHQISCNLQS